MGNNKEKGEIMSATLDGRIGFIFDNDDGGGDNPTPAVLATRRHLLEFVRLVGALTDAYEWDLLERLLDITTDNVRVARSLGGMVRSGASIDEVRQILGADGDET